MQVESKNICPFIFGLAYFTQYNVFNVHPLSDFPSFLWLLFLRIEEGAARDPPLPLPSPSGRETRVMSIAAETEE